MRQFQAPVFVTSIYRESYLPFLAPHLSSVREHQPDADQVVYWKGLPNYGFGLLKKAFPNVLIIEAEQSVAGKSPEQVIPQKTLTLAGSHYAIPGPNAMLF